MDKNNRSAPRAILRVKRKRNEEPLEALVYESTKRRKSKGGINVFKFAETVEDDEWTDDYDALNIKDRIAKLNEDTIPTTLTSNSVSTAESSESGASPSPSVGSKRKFTVVERELQAPLNSSSPSIAKASSTGLTASTSSFTIYDAIPDLNESEDDADPEMRKFRTLLSEYLKVTDKEPASSSKATLGSPNDINDHAEDGQDFVWDVYYHTPVAPLEWANNPSFATITGMPVTFEELDSSDEDSEIQDEADEDSNAEDWYANDYPDEEESDESNDSGDLFHEASEDDEDDEDGAHGTYMRQRMR